MEGVVIALNSLYAALCTLHDKRDARGPRYALVTVLAFILLAKLGDQDHLQRATQGTAGGGAGSGERAGTSATVYSATLALPPPHVCQCHLCPV